MLKFCYTYDSRYIHEKFIAVYPNKFVIPASSLVLFLHAFSAPGLRKRYSSTTGTAVVSIIVRNTSVFFVYTVVVYTVIDCVLTY